MTFWRQLAVIFLFRIHCVYCSVVYVKPTGPSKFNVDCPYESHCYSLQEWVETGATNNTTVVLLSGHHVINNSALSGLSTENLYSFTLTGDTENEGTTLTCTGGFTFNFKYCSNITISHIVLHSCTIVFTYIKEHILITNVTVIDGALKIYHYLPDVYEDSSVYRVTRIDCVVQAEVCISGSTFYNSSLAVKIDSIYNRASCIQLDVRDVFIKDTGRNDVEYVLHVTNTYLVSLNNVTLTNNYSPSGGLCVESANRATFTNMNFWNGFPRILALNQITEVIFRGVLSFKGNRGPGYGVTIFSVERVVMDKSYELSVIEFTNNHIGEDLLRIYRTNVVWITYTAMAFLNNTSEGKGIMTMDNVYYQSSYSSVIFQYNSALRSTTAGAVMLLEKTGVELYFESSMFFSHNSALLSGGITLSDSSSISFEDSAMVFEYNKGGNGGAIAFYDRSYIANSGREKNKTILYFHKNQAMRGGAIFVKDSDYLNSLTHEPDTYFIRRPTYTIQVSLLEPNHSTHAIIIDLSKNTATISGNDIYGGWIDSYSVAYLGIISSERYESGDHHNAISSDPTRICMCVKSVPQCEITEHQEKVFPGQTFEIEAVAVGQRMGIVPSVVIIEPSDNEASLDKGQNIQSVNRNCSTVNIKVLSEKDLVTLRVMAQNDGEPNQNYVEEWLPSQRLTIFSQLVITVALKNCPLGFYYKQDLRQCSCLDSIKLHIGVNCDLETYTIVRSKHTWLLATSEHNKTQYHGVIVHNRCPHNYCRMDTDSLSLQLEFPDDQCALNRSGILCGACQQNLSQVLGTSRCIKCTNIMALALVPGIILAGVLLVGFLMLLNLTVSTGTINGLIFYANVIRASQSTFFEPEFNSSFLSTFIAWLNLDLGMEICFYNGLDAYAKTWLQFVFPLYIWVMVITIIVASHYSTTVSRLFPHNALQVLATLFLLSYAKIFRTVITVFSSTILVYPDGFQKRVWLYDGNIEFLTGRHLPLFVVTLTLLILISVPYTLTLVSIQWLQRVSHYRFLSWVHRFMPLFEAYTGPYQHKHRYWTGLLLLVRIMILTVFSLNRDNNPSVNLLAIAVIAFSLQLYVSFVRVYKKLLHNVLEVMSLINIGFLSVSTLFQLLNDKSLTITTKSSTSIAFVLFLLIILYHLFERLRSQKMLRARKEQLIEAISNFVKVTRRARGRETGGRVYNNIVGNFQEITHSSVELCEPLNVNERE